MLDKHRIQIRHKFWMKTHVLSSAPPNIAARGREQRSQKCPAGKFDNGSEYINRHVAELLDKLLIEEHTKSRSRHSNDNAQAESKNGSIVRKHFGYSHIPQRFAREVNEFCREHLNPYVNFHRPCLFAETITDAKGRQRKRYPYPLMMTPYEKFKSLPEAECFLKPEISFAQLDSLARALSDNEAAQRLNEARSKLFKTIARRSAA